MTPVVEFVFESRVKCACKETTTREEPRLAGLETSPLTLTLTLTQTLRTSSSTIQKPKLICTTMHETFRGICV